jgi:hypothetical protein
VLAAAPQRELALGGRPWPVRWYYDVWTRLPEVRRGLFGRGVIGVSVPGCEPGTLCARDYSTWLRDESRRR